MTAGPLSLEPPATVPKFSNFSKESALKASAEESFPSISGTTKGNYPPVLPVDETSEVSRLNAANAKKAGGDDSASTVKVTSKKRAYVAT